MIGPTTPDLTIIVPSFNEAHRLADGMRRLELAASEGAVDLERTEVVVVDDGSSDDTADTARKLLAGLPHHRVVRHPVNRGKGAAVRTGVGLARSPLLAYMDADMAIDPRAIPSLLDGLHAADLAIGSRALPDSMVESTYLLRSLMGRLFNHLVTRGTGLDLLDTQCGFKGLRTPAARLLFHLVRIDRFAFDVEVLAQARRLGMRIDEVPVQWRHVPGSTVHPLHDSATMLADVFRSRLSSRYRAPVPVATVRATRRGRTVDRHEVHAVLADALPRTPLPVIEREGSVLVLLPLVEPDGVAGAVTALRARSGLAVDLRSLAPPAVEALGPITT